MRKSGYFSFKESISSMSLSKLLIFGALIIINGPILPLWKFIFFLSFPKQNENLSSFIGLNVISFLYISGKFFVASCIKIFTFFPNK